MKKSTQKSSNPGSDTPSYPRKVAAKSYPDPLRKETDGLKKTSAIPEKSSPSYMQDVAVEKSKLDHPAKDVENSALADPVSGTKFEESKSEDTVSSPKNEKPLKSSMKKAPQSDPVPSRTMDPKAAEKVDASVHVDLANDAPQGEVPLVKERSHGSRDEPFKFNRVDEFESLAKATEVENVEIDKAVKAEKVKPETVKRVHPSEKYMVNMLDPKRNFQKDVLSTSIEHSDEVLEEVPGGKLPEVESSRVEAIGKNKGSGV
ncbi:hypothetical protein DICA1_A10198 [Diutina catenulata]